MSWVEVDGAGWTWVLGLVIPFFVLLKTKYISKGVARTPANTQNGEFWSN